MEEPTQQPSDNSIRQANSIETEAELDAAILAAVQRANEVHSVDSPADASDEPLFADNGFDTGIWLGYLIEPSYEHESEDLSLQSPISPDGNIDEEFFVGMMPAPSDDQYEDKDLSLQAPIYPPVEAQQALQKYNLYRFFECTFSGRMEYLRQGGVTAIAITPDGQTLVCSSINRAIKLWNLHTGKWLRSIREHLNYVYLVWWAVLWSHHGLPISGNLNQ